jgi:FKBP-type peptidyl-prolyl cis-trans isomerase SlyD
MSNSSITADKAVAIHFTLTLDSGEVVDSSDGQAPMFYLHGHGNIVPGLEQALEGKAVGEKLTVVVPPEDGFGERHPAGVQEVPRSDFPEDIEFYVDMQLAFEGDEGQVAPGWVKQFTDDVVTIDLNHPQAGECLHFDVEIKEIRDATPEELEHGHPHGPGGHHH